MVAEPDGPSVERLLTISVGLGVTESSEPARRTVDDDPGGTETDRRTRDPDVRSTVGVGSNPFSSMRAIASALMDSSWLDEGRGLERRVEERRRALTRRVDERDAEFDVERAPAGFPPTELEDRAIETPLPDADRAMVAIVESADVSNVESLEPRRSSVDGATTTGATGRSGVDVSVRGLRVGADTERRRDPRDAMAPARVRSSVRRGPDDPAATPDRSMRIVGVDGVESDDEPVDVRSVRERRSGRLGSERRATRGRLVSLRTATGAADPATAVDAASGTEDAMLVRETVDDGLEVDMAAAAAAASSDARGDGRSLRLGPKESERGVEEKSVSETSSGRWDGDDVDRRGVLASGRDARRIESGDSSIDRARRDWPVEREVDSVPPERASSRRRKDCAASGPDPVTTGVPSVTWEEKVGIGRVVRRTSAVRRIDG